MNVTSEVALKAQYERTPLLDRIRVRWRNWRNRKVAKAYRVLSQALKNDPGYRQAWQANIAMPIYDATRPKCHCAVLSHVLPNGHAPECEMLQIQDSRRFECRDMPAEQSNYIADKLMKHLFGV